MFEKFKLQIQYRPQERQILNILLALATGILTLIFPNFLYLIAAGYLIALGIVFIAFKLPSFISALPIVAGLIIFILPELIPFTFALFLGLFGLMMLFAFHFTFLGVVTLIIAVLIVTNPESVAYLIAAFLLFYAFSNLIRLYQEWQNPDHKSGDGPVSVQ